MLTHFSLKFRKAQSKSPGLLDICQRWQLTNTESHVTW